MQSKTSFFNGKLFHGTLFRKDLTRFWPLWGMVSFVGALFPLALWMSLSKGSFGEALTPLEMATTYYIVAAECLPIVSLVYAILCAMLVWSYLYNARSVGLMHTLPIRREGLFVTHFLAGLTMLLIPYAVTGALCVIVSALYGGFALTPLLTTIAAVAGESFFYFASATLVAFITGNVFALPVLYGGLHFLAPALDLLVSSLAEGFLFGFNSGYSGAVEFLSPTMYLMNHVSVDRVYEYAEQRAPSGGLYMESTLTAVDLKGLWLVGVYALAGAVCVLLAWLLYRRRRSETAGDVVAVGWLRPVFRFGIAALAAIGGGLLLYLLLWNSFQSGEIYDVVPLIVCMIVAGAIGYYAASMLLAKSLKVFRGSWRGMALVAVGCVVLCCALRFDLLGIEDRVPEVSQVTGVELCVAGNTYEFDPGEDEELLEEVRTVHRAILAEKDYIRASNEDYWNHGTVTEEADGDAASYYNYLRLEYTLADGSKVLRSYSFPMTQARIAREGTYDRLLDALVNSQTMKYRRLHAGDAKYAINGGYLNFNYGSYQGYDLRTQQAAAVAEAVRQDCDAGSWGSYDWFDQSGLQEYALHLSLTYEYQGDPDDTDWIGVDLAPGMEHTIACLKELGLVTDEDLVTWEELDRQEDLLVNGAAETEASEEAAEVIGGGDELTAILVTEG